jgi:predicted S18 family serine protease
LEQYQQIVRSYQERIAEANLSINITIPTYLLLNTASVIAPAVRTVGSFQSVSYEGVSTTLTLEMIAGKGRVLVSTKPVMGEVFQDTAVLAKETAERLSGKSLANYDLIFSIEAPSEIPAVDGPSAGAAMCLLVLSLIDGEALSANVAVTGTINPDGTVGEIGGVLEKAQAAREAGSTLLLVSEENSQLTIYREETTTRWGRVFRRQVPVQVSAEEYIETNVGIEVELVHDVEDLLRLAAA